MLEIYRNQRFATLAVCLGLGGLGLTGCGDNAPNETASKPPSFDLCPPHAFKAVEIAPEDIAQASATTYAEALACFVLREQDAEGSDFAVGSSTNSSGDEEASIQVARSVIDEKHNEIGHYLMRVTAPSADDLQTASADPTHLSKDTLNSVSIAARENDNRIFSYSLHQKDDGWHFGVTLNKEGYHRSYSAKVRDQNAHRFEGLSAMATQIACFADQDIPPSEFFPTFVQFNDILAGSCLPRDHVGTPKTFLPALQSP